MAASTRLEMKDFKTSLKKLGAIIGDDTQIGCGCVLNPGTLIEKESLCRPLACLKGFYPANSIIKR